MTNTFMVLAHPEIQSFNGALHNEGIKHLESLGHSVNTTDLYRTQFGPVSDRSNFTTCFDESFLKPQLEEIHASQHDGFNDELKNEMTKMESCDLMIWQFPLWWFSVPAILKGWVDRVFAMGRIYDHEHIYTEGKLKGRKVLLSLTVGGDEAMYTKEGLIGDINAILRPIHRGILQFVGFEVLQPQITYAPVHLTHQQRVDELSRYRARLENIHNESGIDVGGF